MPLVTRQATSGFFFREPTEPPNPNTGDVWVDTDTGVMSTFDGTNWVEQTGGAQGSARENLSMNTSGDALAYTDSPQSLMTGTGDLLQSSGANTPARLALGNAAQALVVNSGATAVEWGAAGIDENAEESSTPVTDDAETNSASGLLLMGNQITLPTTSKFYKITAVEWKNGGTVADNIVGIVALVDGDPPVGTEMLVVAYTPITAQSGADAVQKVSVQSSIMLAPGAKLTGGIIFDGATGEFRFDTTASLNSEKTAFGNSSPPIPFDPSIAWNASTIDIYLKIYFRGYG